MNKREFITLLGGAAAAWPLAARAQQRERMRRIGVVTNLSSDDPAQQSRVLAFAQTLAQWGWTEGRNVRIDIRWGATDPDPGLGSIARGGGAPDQRARCRRDRARHYRIHAALEWRPDRGSWRGCVFPSRCDHQAGGQAPAARTLFGPCVRHRWWPDRLRT